MSTSKANGANGLVQADACLQSIQAGVDLLFRGLSSRQT